MSNCRKAVVFLTPSGGKPKTAGENSKVRVVPLSWKKVAEFLDYPSGDSEKQTFRFQCRNHIRRSILMCKEERSIVVNLLREGENKKTIRKIMEYLPNLGDEEYRERYRKIVAKVVSAPDSGAPDDFKNDDLELSVYPKTGIAKELKIKVKQWNRASLPLTLMLYQYEKSAVRVLVHYDDYNGENEKTLEKFANEAELKGAFDQVTGWTCWRAVLDEPLDDIPETTISEKLDVYDDAFWVQVEKKLRNQLTPGILSTIWEMVNKNEIAQTRE